jgi:hypothetical protein
MKIVCRVDQPECFRRGIDAKDDTVVIDVDPSKLSPEMRVFIADHLTEGNLFSAGALGSPTYDGFIEAVHLAMPVAQEKMKAYFTSLGLRRLGVPRTPPEKAAHL